MWEFAGGWDHRELYEVEECQEGAWVVDGI